MSPSPRLAVISLALALAGCAAQAAHELDGSDLPTPALSTTDTVPNPSSAPAPPAETGAAPLVARDACVMLYECGCNSSCVTVDQPRLGFREGDLVMVKSGNLKGTEVYVVKNKTALGADVWTVQRADPRDGVQACGGPDARSLIGYVCATSNSGPPRACVACEDE